MISLKNNRLKSILNHAFFGINQANFVDFFGNFDLNDISLDSFHGINEAHISYESFLHLYSKYDFSYFELNTLNLAQNNINTLRRDSIKGTFSQLILDVNSLSHFEIDTFGFLPNLKEISFLKNQIKSLNFANAFRFVLSNMEKLIFKYNKITSIDGAEFFSNFPNLIYMDLSSNNFFELKNAYFLKLFNLKSLYLGNNQILTIESETFDHMTNLTYLDLSNNLLYDLNAALFLTLTNLNELVLRGNKFETLVVELTSLYSLDLSFNLIKSFEFNLTNLKTLKLGSNLIRKFVSLSSSSSLEHLDVSFNNLTSFENTFESLKYLDLSHNTKLSRVDTMGDLKVLNVSNTNADLILNLNLSLSLEEIDSSSNNLSDFKVEHFTNLKQLKALNLRETHLTSFQFFNTFTSTQIKSIDLSGNLAYRETRNAFIKNFRPTHLELSKLGLTSFDLYYPYEYLDLSFNELTILEKFITLSIPSLRHLDLSHNNFDFFISNELELDEFVNFKCLKVINLERSLSSLLSNTIFYFNKLLDVASLSNNNLNFMPKLCQVCLSCNLLVEESNRNLNVECKLKQFHFESNKLTRIFSNDLIKLNNLEHLNLANNSIQSIELNSFDDLFQLETLLLSLNELSYFEYEHEGKRSIFSPLVNLRLLNLSANCIENVTSHLLDSLLKLEVLDISLNRILFLSSYSFSHLINLRSLYLNDNERHIDIESNETFFKFNSIQNIYLSKSILSETNKRMLVNLFEEKKKQLNKTVLGKSYFKSLFLTSAYIQYDCEMTLFFIKKNVHFNFKTESDIFDYFNECSLLSIKNFTYLLNDGPTSGQIGSVSRIFSDFRAYFFWAFLLFVVTLGVYFLIQSNFSQNDKKLKINICVMSSHIESQRLSIHDIEN